MIHVKCYACGASHEVSDDKAGKKLKCRECGVVVSIPQSDGLTAELQIPGGVARPPLPTPSPSSASAAAPPAAGGGNTGLLIGLSIGGGVLVVAGIVVGIVFAVGGFGDKEPDNDDDSNSKSVATGSDANSPAAKLEQVNRDFIRLLNEYATTLKRIQNNPASAQAAVAPVAKLCREMQALGSRITALPRLSVSEESRLARTYESQAKSAVQAATQAASNIPRAAQFNRALRLQMQFFGTATQRAIENDQRRANQTSGS